MKFIYNIRRFVRVRMFCFKYVGGISWVGLAVRYIDIIMVDKLKVG